MKKGELKTCIECITRFENLTELFLHFGQSDFEDSIDDCLSLIGQKCNKLLKLDLYIGSDVYVSNQFFNQFSSFKNIERLKISIHSESVLSVSVECFKHCKQLTHLYISYDGLRGNFFANIASFVPNLRSIKILTFNQMSDSFINNFHSMKDIQKVHLIIHDFPNRIFLKRYYYFGKSLSEVMLCPNGMNVKPINDNCSLIIPKFIDSFYNKDEL